MRVEPDEDSAVATLTECIESVETHPFISPDELHAPLGNVR